MNDSPPLACRLVSLISSATEILFAIGLGERVVGVSHECDWPAEVAALPRVTRAMINSAAASAAIDVEVKQRLAAGLPLYAIDEDLLASLAPDLIITQAQCDVCAIRYEDVVSATRTLPALASTRVLPLLPQSLVEILGDVLRVGAAAGARQAAQRVYQDLAARVASVSSKADAIPLEHRPRAACIEWVEPLMLAGNWVPELVQLAGGRNLLARGGEHSAYWPWEAVVAADPDVLVVTPCGFDLVRGRREAERLATLPGWSRLAAVQNRRVYVVDGNAYFNRSGPRIVDSLEILAHLFHPRSFPSPPANGWQPL